MSFRMQLLAEVIKKLYFFCLPTSTARMNYLIKHQVFGSYGENCFFQPRKLPPDPKMLRLHNNVAVGADVTFYSHDVIYLVFSKLDPAQRYEHMGCIEVMDNCFIGGHSIILPNVRIGPNAIVAAGSVVTKDVPEGTIVGGNPAVVIGSFDALFEKRKKEAEAVQAKYGRFDPRRAEVEWERFYQQRQQTGKEE